MSSRNSILLSADNEHWYLDTLDPCYIGLEINRNNIIRVIQIDLNVFNVFLDINCDLAKQIINKKIFFNCEKHGSYIKYDFNTGLEIKITSKNIKLYEDCKLSCYIIGVLVIWKNEKNITEKERESKEYEFYKAFSKFV